MDEYIERDAASADSDRNKIKTPFAKIVVEGTPGKPYYNIWYFDPANEECHIGFGSYCLDNVFNWLAEEFEITEPHTDVAPVVHGRWIFTKRHLWYKDENGNIDEWRVDNGFHNGPECQICHTAFCEHCTPDWSTTECEIGHYYCSECAETSRDAHENYCPNCGAKMDGGDGDAAD